MKRIQFIVELGLLHEWIERALKAEMVIHKQISLINTTRVHNIHFAGGYMSAVSSKPLA